MLLSRLLPGSIFLTDKAKAYYSFCLDYPDMNLLHAVVNHARADRNGFTWHLVLGPEDGTEFEGGRVVDVTPFSPVIFCNFVNL